MKTLVGYIVWKDYGNKKSPVVYWSGGLVVVGPAGSGTHATSYEYKKDETTMRVWDGPQGNTVYHLAQDYKERAGLRRRLALAKGRYGKGSKGAYDVLHDVWGRDDVFLYEVEI